MIPRPWSLWRIAPAVASAMLILMNAGASAQARPVSGVVYADRNGNGVRDAGESGLRGVIVSNQVDVAVTDSLGAFALGAAPTGVIFVSVPSGYRAVGRFWRAVDSTIHPLAFGLQPERQPATFTFVHASDSHVSPENVGLTRRFRALVDSLHPSFVLVAGDLVKDAMSTPQSQSESYFDLFASEASQIKVPVWTVPGNHDHFGVIRSRSHVDPANPSYGRGMYRRYFGPDYYSFTYGGVHFIGLNTVALDDSAYYGFVDSVQLAWIKRDVARIPSTMPIVTFDHIPFVSSWWDAMGPLDMPLVGSVAKASGRPTYRHTVGNFAEVIDALRDHNYVLALGAHTHVPEQVQLVSNGRPIRFEQSAAIAGGPFYGPLRFPPGFSAYTVRQGDVGRPVFVPIDTTRRAPAPRQPVPR